MEYTSKEIQLKNGKACLIRRPEESDAEAMLDYLKATSAETPYMGREPEEHTMGAEEEAEFIRRNRENPRALMLSAYIGGRLAGSASFTETGGRIRMRHRCTVGISLYRAFWGQGIGTALVREILAAAKTAGYEQAELTVVSTNAPAIALYKKLGFETTGTHPRAFKYRDGSYADFLFMVKYLQ